MDILFQDDYFIAVNKPAGLLVHATRIDRHEKKNLVDILNQSLDKKVKVIHRLDKPVSGVVLFALTPTAAQMGTRMFAERQVIKSYLALARGYTPAKGSIDHPLGDVKDGAVFRQKRSQETVKESRTEYNRLAKVELPIAVNRYPQSRYSLLEVLPQTGRTHQIRRHLKQIKHPIIGDTKYGDHRHNHYFKTRWGVESILLNAIGLAFSHPITEEPVEIRANISKSFVAILKEMGLAESLPHSPLFSQARSK